MLNIGSYVYSPVLRLKKGEYTALGQLPLDILGRLFPLFVIPPPKERDPELQRALTASELVLIPGQRLGRHWPLRPCMFDPRYLFKKLGVDTAIEWLPQLFRVAIGAHARPILVSDLRTVEGSAFDAVETVVRNITHNLALRITLDDLTRGDLRKRIHAELLKLALKPQECILIMDFGKAEMSNPEAVSDILLAEFQKVMDFGVWGPPMSARGPLRPIAALPDFLVEKELAAGTLVALMKSYPLPEAGLHIVRPPGHYPARKVRVLTELLIEHFG
jgi:hypothetical protein